VSKCTTLTGPWAAAGAQAGLGDGVVAAEHDWQRAGGEHLSDGRLDRRV
jgi:hypothetical protein